MSLVTAPNHVTRWRALLVSNRSVRVAELLALACVIGYLLLALLLIVLLPPNSDEAEYASPVVNLLQTGKFATTLYEPKGGTLPGREEIIYYFLPGHPLTSIPLIAIFGASVVPLRLKALFFLTAAVFLVFKVLKTIGLPRPYPALAAALVCVNRNWLQTAVIARPEPQAFFCGLAGAYLFITSTRNHKPLGAALGGILVGFSVISHVNALMFGLVCLAVAVHEIRRDFKNTSTYAGGLGVLLSMTAYGAFTRIRPDQFRAQIGWNSNVWGRTDTWSHPIEGVLRELHRWAPLYWTSGSLPQQGFYVLISAISLGAILFVAIRRKGSSPLRWIAPLYAVAAATTFALFNNISTGHYFFYRTVVADVCIVSLLVFFSTEERKQRALLSVAVATVFFFHAFRDLVLVRNSMHEHREFDALVHTMRANQKMGDVAMGPPELAFALGFSPNYVVDDNFGFYSGRRPNWIALNREPAASPPLIEAALAGACIAYTAHTMSYLAFVGPAFAAQIERDKDRLCPYLRNLSANAKSIYRSDHYELLRVEHSDGG